MLFFLILVILFLVSIGLSYRSLRHLTHLKEIEGVKKELYRGKILFKNDTYSS